MREQLAKRLDQVVWDHIWHVRWVLARYIEDTPHNCLRIEDNRVIFLLLTMKGDPQWCYRVDELHPRACDHRPWGNWCWCDWEPIGMSIVNLINYLRLEGPYDQERIPTASEEDASPRGTSSLIKRVTLKMREMFLQRRAE